MVCAIKTNRFALHFSRCNFLLSVPPKQTNKNCSFTMSLADFYTFFYVIFGADDVNNSFDICACFISLNGL
jgi:hypothetical protein